MSELIHEKMAAILKELKAIPKKRAPQGSGIKYMFRGIDDVLAALNPLLAEHKVVCMPTVVNQVHSEYKAQSGKTMQHFVTTMRYRFYAEDGSCMECSMVGEGSDTGDKASNKSVSGAFKAMAFQVFCIPTEENVDSEEDNEPLGEKADQPADEPKEQAPPDESAHAQSDFGLVIDGCSTKEDLDTFWNDNKDAIFKLPNDSKIATINKVNARRKELS